VSLIRYHKVLLIGAQNTHRISKLVVFLVPGPTPTVLSLPPLTTSATKNCNLQIPVHLSSDPPPPTASKPPDLPVSSTCTRKRQRHYMAHHAHVLPYSFHSRPGRCNTYAHRPQQLFPDTCRWWRGKEMHTGAYLWFGFFAICFFSLQSFIIIYLYYSGTHEERKPGQYFLTVAQMVENDHPVPSYLANVFHKSEGWVETPQLPLMLKTSIRSMRLTEKLCILSLRSIHRNDDFPSA
jgi:RNA exonuclease 1